MEKVAAPVNLLGQRGRSLRFCVAWGTEKVKTAGWVQLARYSFIFLLSSSLSLIVFVLLSLYFVLSWAFRAPLRASEQRLTAAKLSPEVGALQ